MNSSALVFDSIAITRGAFSLEANTSFPAGKISVILGPSGCGKTTLLDMAAGFLQPAAGRILEGDADVTDLPPEGRRVGVVFQDHALFPHLSVRRNIMFGPISRGMSKDEAERRADELLVMIRLEDYADRRPSSLSGGEKQRVALARALAIDPELLLLDEPFSALDAALRRELRSEVKRIQSLTGVTVLLVTHDQEEALAMADHLAVMNGGRIVEEGSPEAIWTAPKTLFAGEFLGRSSRLTAQEVADGPNGLLVTTAAGSIVIPNSAGHESAAVGDSALFFRPDAATLDPDGSLEARVLSSDYIGGKWRISAVPTSGMPGNRVIIEAESAKAPERDMTFRFHLDPDRARLLQLIESTIA